MVGWLGSSASNMLLPGPSGFRRGATAAAIIAAFDPKTNQCVARGLTSSGPRPQRRQRLFAMTWWRGPGAHRVGVWPRPSSRRFSATHRPGAVPFRALQKRPAIECSQGQPTPPRQFRNGESPPRHPKRAARASEPPHIRPRLRCRIAVTFVSTLKRQRHLTPHTALARETVQ